MPDQCSTTQPTAVTRFILPLATYDAIMDGQYYFTVMQDKRRGRLWNLTPERLTEAEARADLEHVRDEFPEAFVSRCQFFGGAS